MGARTRCNREMAEDQPGGLGALEELMNSFVAAGRRNLRHETQTSSGRIDRTRCLRYTSFPGRR